MMQVGNGGENREKYGAGTLKNLLTGNASEERLSTIVASKRRHTTLSGRILRRATRFDAVNKNLVCISHINGTVNGAYT